MPESDLRLSVIVDSIADGFYALDRGWRFVHLNDSALAYFGRTRDELLGRAIYEIAPNFRGSLFEEEFQRAFDTGAAVRVEAPSILTGRFVEVHAYPGRELLTVLFRDVSERKREQEALEETRRELERTNRKVGEILSSIQDDFYVLDRDWRFVYASERFTRKVGKSPEEFIGKVFWVMFPKDLGTALEENFRAAMERREVRRFEVRGQYSDAVYRVTAFPSADGVTVLGTDITEQKRAEEALRFSEEKFAKAFQGNRAAMVISRLVDGLFIDVNERWEELTGFSRAEALGTASTKLNVWKVRSDRDLFIRELREQGMVRGAEFRFVRKGGEEWTGLVSAQTVTLQGEQVIISSIVDITERERAAAAVRLAKERLEDADRRKNEFLGVLSHELRNPLAPITNSVHVLERSAPGGEQARRALQIIDRQARHLTRLVDDLLDVTRISRGKINLQREPFDLAELARRTADDHHELFARSGVDLEVDAPDPVWVDADRTRIAQIIGNLLTNAIKFTPAGGETKLVVRASDEKAANAVLSVRDTGAGMTEETLRDLFQPFMQADQTLARSRGGLGLGLALVKGLAELHGGSVRAASDGPDAGCEIVVTLPLAAMRERRNESRPAPSARTEGRRVLVIEDNEDAAESLREALAIGGAHDVAVAATGPAGLEAARAFRPDVVLCDIGLPGLDGYGVARAMRADPALCSTFLVALSGYALQEDVLRSEEAGFDRHLAKPPDLAALFEILAKAPPIAPRP